ncbi:hypothetical protein FS749_004972 [Ceratobasidium sp. UAMH 11750]|nr:hypothetical protein FS749_004972 [Ceratobasidium sp. UAMH 11750]
MVMPLLWERVHGVSQFFALVPALDDETYNQISTQNLDGIDFSRFDLYAPWTKNLEIFKNNELSISKRQSDILHYHSARRILFPNLVSITCTHPHGHADSLWILPFLTPSLTSLEFIIVNPLQIPYTSTPESSIVLHLLAETCPKLQTLGIFPVSGRTISSDEYAIEYVPRNSRASVEARLEHLDPFLASIHPLVSLTCSEQILDHACFKTISTWPSLEYLEITLDPADEYSLPELTDTAFPSLKHLGLYWFSPDVFDMFWSVPSLVSKLVSVKLLNGDFCSAKEFLSNILVPILSALRAGSPHLQNLWLRAVIADGMSARYEVPVSVLSDLKGLPLETLHMEGMIFAGRDFSHDDDDENGELEYETGSVPIAQRLTTMFPNLRELAFPNQRMSFADLQTFHSRMPKLGSLRFDFDLGSVSPNLGVDLSTVVRYRHSRFSTLEADFLGDELAGRPIADIASLRYNQIVPLVQYLFSLWPNVQITTRSDEDWPERRSIQKKMIALINEHLAALSSCNRDVSIKYEEIQILNEDSWNQCLK